jgi:hypothetical protein
MERAVARGQQRKRRRIIRLLGAHHSRKLSRH